MRRDVFSNHARMIGIICLALEQMYIFYWVFFGVTLLSGYEYLADALLILYFYYHVFLGDK